MQIKTTDKLATLRANIAREQNSDAQIKAKTFEAGWRDFAALPIAVFTVAGEGLGRGVSKILDGGFWLGTKLLRGVEYVIGKVGDGAIFVTKKLIGRIPKIKIETKSRWQNNVQATWDKTKSKYADVKHAIHDWIEDKKKQVFKWGKKLPPETAMKVLIAASLWVPISVVGGFVGHTLIAAFLPISMQWLHIVPTILPKSKLILLPVYPAAWPQAKKSRLAKSVLNSPFLAKIIHRHLAMKNGLNDISISLGLGKGETAITKRRFKSVRSGDLLDIQAQKISSIADKPEIIADHSVGIILDKIATKPQKANNSVVGKLFGKVKKMLTIKNSVSKLRSVKQDKPQPDVQERLASRRENGRNIKVEQSGVKTSPVRRAVFLVSKNTGAAQARRPTKAIYNNRPVKAENSRA